MNNWLFVAIGGAVGSVARYLLSNFVQRNSFGAFPLGTLFVNASGCLLIGYIGAMVMGAAQPKDDYSLLLMVGVLGGYTTFSAFGWETISMLQNGEVSNALLNIVANNLIGLTGVWFGFRAGKYFLGV